jgi:hypothetical protein
MVQTSFKPEGQEAGKFVNLLDSTTSEVLLKLFFSKQQQQQQNKPSLDTKAGQR